jgi:hypothetical protein
MADSPNGDRSTSRSPRPDVTDATETVPDARPAAGRPARLGWILVGIAALLFGVVCGLIMSSVSF